MIGERGIVIVDDHPLFREGLRSVIRRSGGFTVLGEAGTAREGLRLALEFKPPLALLDISLPDQSGIHLTRQLARLLPAMSVTIVTVHTANNYIAESFQAGARGYVVKESVPETLIEALSVVSNGGYFLEGPVPLKTIERLKDLAQGNNQTAESRYESLTRRQQEVMRLLVQGMSYKGIADKLCISRRTVENHRAQIMEKLDLTCTVDLVLFAAKLGVIEVDRIEA